MNFLKIRQQQSCKLLTVHASWWYNDSRHEFSIFARSVSRPALKLLLDSRTQPQCLRRRRSRYKLSPSLVRCTNRPFGHQRRCVERLIITTTADFTECTAPLISWVETAMYAGCGDSSRNAPTDLWRHNHLHVYGIIFRCNVASEFTNRFTHARKLAFVYSPDSLIIYLFHCCWSADIGLQHLTFECVAVWNISEPFISENPVRIALYSLA